MSLRHIPFAQFEAKSWKNGLGTTYDIALLPENADHTNFDLRFALSPIIEDNVFSAFPGIERVITPIEGEELCLEFEQSASTLKLGQSLRFDSGLAPMGRPTHGPIIVINVMARRERWEICNCGMLAKSDHVITSGEMLFLFALDSCSVQSGDKTLALAKHDAVIAEGAEHISIATANNARVLCALLRPV